eukprot:CAMPEP_0204876124 /NCGR_PEP_ID=MMETSP1348-20121228/47461_1 /ASSEMBLY_ACC=CAM_ASM_000700 /TAXON_ID=215587 /ORGANISM="Aplanochytrium stocchinoi, Strain GSBS06" /LENGTH=615 /DNA_ID=CAMNT_0052032845 /DNA_START=274 /DNA_END=2121 /DNA_ORIENTATION=+
MTSWQLLESVGVRVPGFILKLVPAMMFGVQVPMLSRQSSWYFILLTVLGVAGIMSGTTDNVAVLCLGLSVALFARRLFVSLVTLRASTPTPLVFQLVSHVMPRYSFTREQFFRTDNPPEAIAQKRERAFDQMKQKWDAKWPKCVEMSAYLSESFSDLRFASGNRVFLPFMKHLENWCDPCTVVNAVDKTDLIDIDGHRLTDVSGSYGVNVCGYDRYKQFITEGWELTKNVGCVLGPVHPLLMENIMILKEISKKEEVSFHMSGTEAVMCAVRLVRFNTNKPLIVMFGGAYHGWWDGVQAMAGNERTPQDVLTLKDMYPGSLDVIRLRASEIAAIVINPLQAFHPNAPPPSDLVLASNTRSVSESSLAYKKWLGKLRKLCDELGIVLIFDEVYTGFRLAPGGAQEYFDVTADMVVYGKTTGGGIPNGIVCGPKKLMSRGDEKKPLRVAYVIGTFSAHPLLLGAMNRFLNWVKTPEARAEYDRLRSDVAQWVAETNTTLEKEFGSAPLALGAYSSVWTMLYKRPGRYHWMLQYYLKDEGVNLSWVGTGRLSFSLDFTREDLNKLTPKIIRACHRMEEDGWWWDSSSPDAQGKSPSGSGIKLSLVKEIVFALIKRALT